MFTYGAIVYVNEPLNTLIINELKKKSKKMQKILDTY